MKDNKDKKHWIGRTGPKVKNNIAPKRFHPRRKYCAPDYDQQWGVSGYYNDNDGNDIRDRD